MGLCHVYAWQLTCKNNGFKQKHIYVNECGMYNNVHVYLCKKKSQFGRNQYIMHGSGGGSVCVVGVSVCVVGCVCV